MKRVDRTVDYYHARTGPTSAEPRGVRSAVVARGMGVLRLPAMKLLARCVLVAVGVLVAAAAAAGVPAEARYPSEEALRHYLAGRWLAVTGDLQGAGAEFARAVALDPTAVDVLLEAAEVASRSGQSERTLELARQARVLAPGEARASWLEGAALFNLARAGEALPPLRAAVYADSDNAEYLHTLAHVAEQLDLVALVDSCASRLVQIDPEDDESWFQLATTRARLGDFAGADSALTASLAGNPARPGALFMRGWIRERLGHPEEAIALYTHHLEAHPRDVATRRRLVTLLAQQDHLADALVQARLVSAAEPDDPSASQVEAELEFRAGHVARGRQALERLRARAPGEVEGVARSAEVLVRHGLAREAEALADAWSDARPGDVHGLLLRAWVRSEAGEPDSAIAWTARVVALEPDSTGPRRLLARYLRDAHRWHDAIVEIERLREGEPRDASLLLDLGFCRDQLGDVPAAIQAGRDALALAPDQPAVLNYLGYVLADHERELPEAERLVRRAVEQDPDNGAFLDSMGWVLFRLGRFTQAREQLERALRLGGGDPVIHEHLGDVYHELKLDDLARQQYRLSLAGEPANGRVKSKLEAAH